MCKGSKKPVQVAHRVETAGAGFAVLGLPDSGAFLGADNQQPRDLAVAALAQVGDHYARPEQRRGVRAERPVHAGHRDAKAVPVETIFVTPGCQTGGRLPGYPEPGSCWAHSFGGSGGPGASFGRRRNSFAGPMPAHGRDRSVRHSKRMSPKDSSSVLVK